MTAAVIIFAKVPAAGRVKTRLTPELDDEEAADLYTAFLRDTLARCSGLEADVRLYLAPSEFPLDDALVPGGVSRHDQTGDGLGERMARAFLETFAEGYENVMIIGTDHPTLPTAFVEHAFEALADQRSVVIGPAEDGGYYLLGMNDFMPELFRDMKYGHGDVFRQTLQRLPTTGVDITILPAWYDVDTPEDIARLAAELATTKTHSLRHTHRALGELSKRHPWIRDAGRASANGATFYDANVSQ